MHHSSTKKAISLQISGKPRSAEVRKAISERQRGHGNTFFGRKHTEYALDLIKQSALNRPEPHRPGFSVTFTNVETQETTNARSVRAAALMLQTTSRTIIAYNSSQKLFRGLYKISVDMLLL